MTNDERAAFRERLVREGASWVRAGILTDEQLARILAHPVGAPEPPAGRDEGGGSVASRIPAILGGVAAVLLGVGIMLFYAANWKAMPAPLRLFQILAIMVGLYAGAWRYLVVVEGRERLGRVLLVLGMVSFGAALGLVAQTFHLSAHPASGVLAWAVLCLAMGHVAREPWGAWLALGLAYVWNLWEVTQYGDPNWAFPLLLAPLAALLWSFGSRAGLVVVALEAALWFYQLNFHYLRDSAGLGVDHAGEAFLVLHAALGALLVALGAFAARWEPLRPTGTCLRLLGWLAAFGPAVAFSWPWRLEHAVPLVACGAWFLGAQYLAFLAAALLLRQATPPESRAPFQGGLLLLALVLGAAPVGVPLGQALVGNVALVVFLMGLLHGAHDREPVARLESVLAALLGCGTLLAKQISFLIFAASRDEYWVAYLLGFLVLLAVYALAALGVDDDLRRRGRAAPAPVYPALAAVLAYVTLYALSFQPTADQASIFGARPEVLVALGAFAAVAFALLAHLRARGVDRGALAVAGALLVAATALLVVPGASLPPAGWTLVFNALLLAYLGLLLWGAARANSGAVANLAVAGFVLLVVTRYFDVLWDMLSGSALFIVTGLLVLVGGQVLERQRRRFLAALRAGRGKGGEGA